MHFKDFFTAARTAQKPAQNSAQNSARTAQKRAQNAALAATFALATALALSGCGPRVARDVLTPQQSDARGFVPSAGSALQSPPADKARVYILRPWKFASSAISLNYYYQYEPLLDSRGRLVIDKGGYIDNVIGKLRNGERIHADFDAGKTLLITAGGGWTAKSYVVFTPQAGKTYCLNGRFAIINGFLNERQCEKFYRATRDGE